MLQTCPNMIVDGVGEAAVMQSLSARFLLPDPTTAAAPTTAVGTDSGDDSSSGSGDGTTAAAGLGLGLEGMGPPPTPMGNPFVGATLHREVDPSGQLDLSWSSNRYAYAYAGRLQGVPPLPPPPSSSGGGGGAVGVQVGAFAAAGDCCGSGGGGGMCCAASHALMFAKMHRVALALSK